VFEDLRQWLAAAARHHVDVLACLRATNQTTAVKLHWKAQ